MYVNTLVNCIWHVGKVWPAGDDLTVAQNMLQCVIWLIAVFIKVVPWRLLRLFSLRLQRIGMNTNVMIY